LREGGGEIGVEITTIASKGGEVKKNWGLQLAPGVWEKRGFVRGKGENTHGKALNREWR